MLVGEFGRKAAPVVYTTSDAGAKYLYKYLCSIGQADWVDNVMSEYLPFKYAIALEEIYNAVSNRKDYNDVYNSLSSELKQVMSKMPSSMNYGHTYSSLTNCMNEYAFKKPFEMAFLFQVRTIIIPTNVANELYRITRQDVNNSFARISNGQSANAGCGCASAVACMALLAMMILCMVIL